MFRKRTRAQPLNLLALTPRRRLEWEHREENLVTLIIPKFKSRWMARWFVPMLAKPTIRVKLDRFGSFFWERCDGVATIERIGEEMAQKFEEPLDSMYERLGTFVRTLEKDGFIVFAGNTDGGEAGASSARGIPGS